LNFYKEIIIRFDKQEEFNRKQEAFNRKQEEFNRIIMTRLDNIIKLNNLKE
jgi:hypothetical protein